VLCVVHVYTLRVTLCVIVNVFGKIIYMLGKCKCILPIIVKSKERDLGEEGCVKCLLGIMFSRVYFGRTMQDTPTQLKNVQKHTHMAIVMTNVRRKKEDVEEGNGATGLV